MKRFRFRLQGLLQLERHRVHAARLALATQLRQLADLDQQRSLMRKRIVEATDRYREAIVGGVIDPHEIGGRQRTLSRLQAGLHAADEEREGLQARVEECRHALAAVRAREQLLERRRDDAREEWRREADRVEADLIDEFLSGRKARSQPGAK
jgi:flagellar export protein FliJ